MIIKNKKTWQRYLVIYVQKECVKFQKDRCSRFWAIEFTDFEKAKCEKNALSFKDFYTRSEGRRRTTLYLR